MMALPSVNDEDALFVARIDVLEAAIGEAESAVAFGFDGCDTVGSVGPP